MERLTGLEPATTCLEGRDPTIGLQPHMWWAELESNQPSCEAPDLQSGPLPATGYRPICALPKKGRACKGEQCVLSAFQPFQEGDSSTQHPASAGCFQPTGFRKPGDSDGA